MDGDDFAHTGDTDDDGLEAWIEDAFGTRDEELVQDDGLEEELDRRRVVLREAYRKSRVAADEIEHEIERAVEDAEAASGRKRELLLARVVRRRERYERKERELRSEGRRLAAVLVIRTLRRTGDGLPESSAARNAISKAYRRSPLRSESFNAHVEAVAAALEIDEPLSWVETWVPIRTRPHEQPVDGDPIEDGQWSALDVDDISLDDVDPGR